MNHLLKYISEVGLVTYRELTDQVFGLSRDVTKDVICELEDLVRRNIIAQDPKLGMCFRSCEEQVVIWNNKPWIRRFNEPANSLRRGYSYSYLSKEQDRFWIHPAQTFVAKAYGELYRVRHIQEDEFKTHYDHVLLIDDIEEVIQYDQVPKNLSTQEGLKSATFNWKVEY